MLRMRYILAVVLLCGLCVWLARDSVRQAIGDWLVVEDRLQPADVIHVIAGPDDRTDHAIQLYHQGYGERLFFTGGWCRFHQYEHGAHGRERALEQGVPLGAIVVNDAPVTSTYSETWLLKDYIDSSDGTLRSVIVVSDPHHMRRARWTCRRILGRGISIQMSPVPFDASPYARRWWTDAATRRLVRDEYGKLLYYVLRYQLAWGSWRQWLASLDTE